METVTATGAEVVVLPAASCATAVTFTLPLAVVVVSQLTEKGAVVATPIDVVPAKNSTCVTPTLSAAFALTATVPLTVPAAGAVRETVGATISGAVAPRSIRRVQTIRFVRDSGSEVEVVVG